MSNVRLNWGLPTPSVRQRPLAGFRIEARVSAELPWTEIALVEVPATEILLEDVAPGQWFYRGFVVDVAGRSSTPVNATVEVDFEDPSPATEFSATLV